MKLGRTLAVGDIHGALKALEEVLDKAKYDFVHDTLIFLGDYVDGWPDSAQVINKLIYLQNKAKSSPGEGKVICIRGNHDKWCEQFLLNGGMPSLWINQGGRSTLKSYNEAGLTNSHEHREFFKNLLNYYIDDENRGFVHGGFVSKHGLGHDAQDSNYYWDRDLWELAVAIHKDYANIIDVDKKHDEFFRPNPYRFLKHKEVFIGHTTTNYWQIKPHYPEYNDPNQGKNGPITIPMNRCNVWNLDTGCGYNGRLSIMDVDTKEYWQSTTVQTLYPGQFGR